MEMCRKAIGPPLLLRMGHDRFGGMYPAMLEVSIRYPVLTQRIRDSVGPMPLDAEKRCAGVICGSLYP